MTFLRMAITPIMRGWLRLTQNLLDYIPRPLGAPRAHSAGFSPDRILLFGGGMAVGWGVTSHDIGLAGSLAREISRRTSRAVDVEVMADPDLTAGSALASLREASLRRYDAVIITLGVNDALRLTPVTAWSRELNGLLDHLAATAPSRAEVFVVGVQPIRSIPSYDSWLGGIANRRATELNRASAELVRSRPRVTFVPVTSPNSTTPAHFRNASSYGYWAREIADAAVPLLDARSRAVGESDSSRGTSSTREELTAIELERIDRDSDGRLRQIVEHARTVFGGSGAGFGVFSAERILFPIRAGDVPVDVSLRGSFGEKTLTARDALIVADAAADARFESNTNVLGPLAVRFWAGFPIEGMTGEQVGLLCVFGHDPRATRPDWDRTVLRQLALMIQRELANPGL